MTPGYSGKPLFQKLGIKPGVTVRVVGWDGDYEALVGTRVEPGGSSATLVHVFATGLDNLSRVVAEALPTLPERGVLWLSWPKRSSGVATDITEDRIRDLVLPLGLVDVKVCAVTDTWSGLKVVRRRR